MNKKNYRRIKDSGLVRKNMHSIFGGFTLVELMVTISIFLIITSVTLVNYGDFKSSVSLQNNTDTVALSIRKAQSYAIGAHGFGAEGSTKVFDRSYGIHFSTNVNGSGLDGSDKSFLIFSMPKGDSGYSKNQTGDCGKGVNQCIEFFNITSTDKIKDISVSGGSGNSGNNKESVDIYFTRPESSAHFCYRNSSGDENSCKPDITSVSIVVSNGQTNEKTKTITVQNTGQISIQ
ncbi:TPA: hypothetical protein DEP30_01295 [Candidatus Nomurabacteria bacterium]|nr:MAG: hypothetical protein UR97_C0002G0084 [Candidatus Nomurabacteria bacterium GW2011_GWE2_36_115]KKP94489.1 MAG: hypothetical protein US00_C0001G0083 [Candidatus Nomurabacteria bacterium GW2011_GWF2_36_126]KKP96951.1 MAG: hypothetical protein US04_C0001G0454 [Candidatus Nomurabacteria bacterium GW2011_GWD2_36_14]KKP99445.1 MAG: hypothetical protein US08_C0001G0127 [Candidatus Nomurabacteria bacterium GW2011_GWF2_36_19]KKQ05699.1 MAG: hypothetical protein US17_C0002G0083 [Candidatus Nomuraba